MVVLQCTCLHPQMPTNLSIAWTQVSGPGIAVFATPDNPVTTATFTEYGVYELLLVATDGAALYPSQRGKLLATRYGKQFTNTAAPN